MSETMIGRKVGQYKITKFIANGGMADVYHAYDEGLDREVALKILFPQYSRDEEFTKRFRREARSAARLRHPNIVQVYATGVTDEGDHYIAMEFVPGGTLEETNSDLGKKGKLIEVGLVLEMMQQIADALRDAHAQGIVHRDLKPSNILMREDNSPVLTDLGIALSGNAPRLTQTNKMMGTPDYMSPEQAQGADLDGRSDIYSFGIMLYELLCGRRPFGNESPWMIIHKQINEEPKPLFEVRPGLDPQIYEIVSRCMAKNPNLRFQSAAELHQAFSQAIATNMAYGGGTDDSSGWQTVSLDTAGIVPPTGGTVQQQASGSTGFPLASQSGPHSSPLSNPNLKPAAKETGISWGIWAAIAVVILAIGGLVSFLLSAMDPSPATTGDGTPLVAELQVTDEGESAEVIIPPTATETATPEPTEVPPTIEIETSPTPAQTNTPVVVVVVNTPTETATPTETPPATDTPVPTVTDTPAPTVPANGDGLPIRFENNDAWTVEGNAIGSITKVDDPVFAGGFAGQIDYEFATSDSDTLTLTQINPIPGRPDTIGVRLFGDGSGNLVNAIVVDNSEQRWLIPLGAINHDDRWAFMSGSLGANNRVPLDGGSSSTLDFPIKFHAFQITDAADAFEGSGTIFVDELSSFAATTNVTVTATPTSEAEGTETPEPSGRNVTITIAPGFRCDDGPHDFPHDRIMTFKWFSNLSPSDLEQGDRFVLTISGGGIANGTSFDSSLTNTPGEWLVNINPSDFGIVNSEDYEWSVRLHDIDNQIIASSGGGCFNT